MELRAATFLLEPAGAAFPESAGDDSSAVFYQWLADNELAAEGAVSAAKENFLHSETPAGLLQVQSNIQPINASQMLEQLTGNTATDAALLSSLNLSQPQAVKLADAIRSFLQRPDVQAGISESVRGQLQDLAAQLQKATGEGISIGAILKSFMQQGTYGAADIKSRTMVLSQMLQWVKQSFSSQSEVPQSLHAPVEEVAQYPFRDSDDDADTSAQEASQNQTLTPLTPIALQAQHTVSMEYSKEQFVASSKALQELADRLAQEAVIKGVVDQNYGDAAAIKGTKIHLADDGFSSLLNGAISSSMMMPYNTINAGSAMLSAKISSEDLRDDGTVVTAADGALVSAADMRAGVVQPMTATSSPVVSIAAVAQHYASARIPVPEQVQIAVRQAVRGGVNRMVIQLQPKDLGRINVRLDLHEDGTAHIAFTTDTQETHEGLQQDVNLLADSLRESGIYTDAQEIEFHCDSGVVTSALQEAQSDPVNHSVNADDGAVQIEENNDILVHTYTLHVKQGVDIHA